MVDARRGYFIEPPYDLDSFSNCGSTVMRGIVTNEAGSPDVAWPAALYAHSPSFVLADMLPRSGPISEGHNAKTTSGDESVKLWTKCVKIRYCFQA